MVAVNFDKGINTAREHDGVSLRSKANDIGTKGYIAPTDPCIRL